MKINDIVDLAVNRGASDAHLLVGYYPALRINGTLFYLRSFPAITSANNEEIVYGIISEEQKKDLIANKELDFGFEVHDNRLRINAYYSRGRLNVAFRLIPKKISTLEELELPESLHKIENLNSGLVLITGPTGQGKSTTIASIINQINLQQSKHILTIEDPIEYVYPAGRSIVSQRELHQDTHSWSASLRSALREDPDIVFVGEMRDFESVSHVLTLAETGHLVFSTLHTISSPEAVNRIIDVFPSHQQNQIRTQLAAVLRTVISQRLLPRIDKKGRIPAVEILHNNPAVANIIREGKLYLLDNVLQTSEQQGFLYFERCLKLLCDAGKISREAAIYHAIRPKEVEKFL